jgi:hypothetical protein
LFAAGASFGDQYPALFAELRAAFPILSDLLTPTVSYP